MVECVLSHRIPFVIHAYESCDDIRLPSMSLVWHCLTHLLRHQDEIRERLLGTLIHMKRLDGMKRNLHQLVLTLYNPQKPLCVTDDSAHARSFLRSVS